MSATLEPPAISYNADRAGSAATIARLRAELAERPTSADVMDARLFGYRQGYQKGRAEALAERQASGQYPTRRNEL